MVLDMRYSKLNEVKRPHPHCSQVQMGRGMRELRCWQGLDGRRRRVSRQTKLLCQWEVDPCFIPGIFPNNQN